MPFNLSKCSIIKLGSTFKYLITLLLMGALSVYATTIHTNKQASSEALFQQNNFTSKIRLLNLKKFNETQFNKEKFNKYFDSQAKVINSTVPLKKEYAPITWPEFNINLPMLDITVVFLTSGRAFCIQKLLPSFFTYNTYPIKKVVMIHDGASYPELENIIKNYPNITWIITNIKVGQLQAVDQAFRHIDTEYFFFSEDDFLYLTSGFIEYGIQAHLYDSKLSGVVVDKRYQKKFIQVGPLKVLTVFHMSLYSGFTFWPSIRLLKDYKMLDGGYSGACFNLSYGMGVGSCEAFISIQYSLKGYHNALSPYYFFKHTEASTAPVKYWSNQSNINLNFKQKWEEYNAWVNLHKDYQSWKDQLNYLIPKPEKDLNIELKKIIDQSRQINENSKKQINQALKITESKLDNLIKISNQNEKNWKKILMEKEKEKEKENKSKINKQNQQNETEQENIFKIIYLLVAIFFNLIIAIFVFLLFNKNLKSKPIPPNQEKNITVNLYDSEEQQQQNKIKNHTEKQF